MNDSTLGSHFRGLFQEILNSWNVPCSSEAETGRKKLPLTQFLRLVPCFLILMTAFAYAQDPHPISAQCRETLLNSLQKIGVEVTDEAYYEYFQNGTLAVGWTAEGVFSGAPFGASVLYYLEVPVPFSERPYGYLWSELDVNNDLNAQ